jgi:hypothetical protein
MAVKAAILEVLREATYRLSSADPEFSEHAGCPAKSEDQLLELVGSARNRNTDHLSHRCLQEVLAEKQGT